MKVIIQKNYENMCRWAAEHIIEAICANKGDKPFVLGLPTGSSPLGVYKNLIEAYKAGRVSFKNVITFNMDEYLGLPREHEQSYWRFMHDNLFDHIDIRAENVNILNGMAPDPAAECARYEAKIAACGGIDLFMGGSGVDGHIAFNEAADVLHATAHIEQLTESTINANARFFEKKEDVPTTAITMGMGDILAAKCVVLIATGLAKTSAIKGLIMDDVITTQNPSSMLKMHENVVVVIDEELAAAVGYKA